jgi:predicted amidohydrolase
LPSNIAIAVAQSRPIAGDVAANAREHLYLARTAAAEGARIILFPELSLTGYEIHSAPTHAFTPDDTRLDALRHAAQDLRAILIVGAPLRLGNSLHIGAYILHPDGLFDLYTKQRMGAFPPEACCDGVVPPAEATVFAPGDCNPLVDLDGTPAAIAICADVGRPAHPEQAASRGARAYLASMFVIPSEFAGEQAKLAGYAARYQMLVAMSNYGAPTGGLASAGRSSIWSPTGELLIQLPAQGSGIAIVQGSPTGPRAHSVMIDE